MNLITNETKYVRLTKGTSPNFRYEDIYKTDLVSIETNIQSTGNSIPRNKVTIITGAKNYTLDVNERDGWALSTNPTVALTATQIRDYLNTYFSA